MKNVFRFLAISAIVAGLQACVPEGDASLTMYDMGTMMDGYVQSDYGYKITFKASEITFDKEKVTVGTRLHLTYMYTVSELTSTEVKATLMAYVIFSQNEIIRESEIPEGIGSDALYMTGGDSGSAWASGGFINAEFLYYQAKNSKTVHDMSLVYLESESRDGNCVFEFHHNAHGETLGYQGYDLSNTELVHGYMSFNYMKPTGGNVTKITIKYPWYKDEYLQTYDLETKSIELKITEPK